MIKWLEQRAIYILILLQSFDVFASNLFATMMVILKSKVSADKGEKLEQVLKQMSQVWQPKDNPTGIGSSNAFETPPVSAPTTVTIVTGNETKIDPPVIEANPIEHNHEVSLEEHPFHENSTNIVVNDQPYCVDENFASIIVHDQPPMSDKSATSFSFHVQNVVDVIVRSSMEAQPPPILEKVLDAAPSDQNYKILPHTRRNLILHKEVDLVAYLLLQGKDTNVPFTPCLSKSQKKKVSKAAYKTSSRVLLLIPNEKTK